MATLANSSLRSILVATFTALVIGTVGAVGLFSRQAGQQAVTTLANQLMAEIGERIDQRLARHLAGLRNVVETNELLIREDRLDPLDAAGLERHFAAQLGLLPNADSIGLVSERRDVTMLARHSTNALIIRRFGAATGYRLQHYRAALDGRQGELIESRQNYDPHNDPPNNPWYPAVRAAGQGSWRLSVSLAKGQDQPLLVCFYALPFDEGRVGTQGVLVAGMTLVGMSEFLRGLRVSASGQAFLVDREGLLVATSTGETPFDSRARIDHTQNVAVETRRLPAVASTNAVTRQAASQLLAAQPALKQLTAPLSFDFDFNGQRYLAQVSAAGPGIGQPDWLTVVVAPQRDFTALIAAPLHQLILLASLALLIAVLLGRLAAGAISRPLRQLNAATRRVADGDFGQPLPPAPIRELRELGESFGKMTARLHDAFFELRDLNRTLRDAEQELAEQNQQLERRVAQRTAELTTAQVRLEEAMMQVAESETKYRTIFEQSPLGVGLTESATGRLLECNRRFGEILGRTQAQLVAIDWMSITHPDDLPLDLGHMARLNAGESAGFEMDKRYLRPDGAVVWVHLTVAPLILRAGGKRCHLGLVEDIAARKAAEAALRQSEARLRSYFEQPLIGIAITSLEKGWLEINDRLCVILGYSRDELRHKTWAELTHPDDLTTDVAEFERVLRGEIDGYSLEKRFVRADGQTVPTEMSVACVRAPDGSPEYIVALIQDATERRRAAEALRESEERFRLAFDGANTGMCLVDIQGRLLQANDQMSAIFGYSRQELEAMTVNDLACPEDLNLSPAVIARAVYGGDDRTTFEKRYRHRQGQVVYAQIASSLVRDAQGRPRYFISQVADITERKRLELEAQQARAAAEAANAAKSNFLAHMSHEIRTPLNVVLGLAQVLSRGPLTANQRDMVARIQIAGQSLLAIINDILDLSKIEAGQLRLESHPIALETLLQRLDTLLAPAAQAKGLTFNILCPSKPLGLLMADALRLEQVLINLIGNAVKFTDKGQVTLSVATLRTDPAAVRLRFAVRDTGIGIAAPALDLLFTPFTQAEEGITRRFGGTGLGLSISKHLLALMGGEIKVESELGQGSTFWFELSCDWATVGERRLTSAAPDRTSPSPAGRRLAGVHVLVVDDSAMNRDLVERALALEGATATLAADGQEAIQQLRAGPATVDAVLMDVRMPVMDGLTATRLIREELGLTGLPVIAFTAGVLTDQQEAARAAGVNGILVKPLDLEEMAVLLLKWVKPRWSVTDPVTAAQPVQPIPVMQAATGHDAAGEFPDIAGIDRVRAAESLRHNRDLFLRLLKQFAAQHADAADAAARDLAQGERGTAARRMHTLRGGAGLIGALNVMALAGELDEAIDRGETDLEDRLAALRRLLGDLITASAAWLETPPAGPTVPAQALPLATCRLGALHEHLCRRNLKALRSFEELRPGLAGALGESRVQTLGHAIRGFRFEEALAVLEESVVWRGSRNDMQAAAMAPTARLLVVDDDPAAIEVLGNALEDLGDVCYATGGADALALMVNGPIDLVLLDANMPDMDGFATCQLLKQEYPDIPMIFVTAFSEEGHELRALQAGAVDFIHKPIKPAVVRARVGVHLQLGAVNAELRALSDRDPLTGIANRRALDSRLAQEWWQAARQRQPLGLLMIDVDQFKRYNDHYGHLQGDDCLRQVAAALATAVSGADNLVARYGGEEFAVVLPGSSPEDVVALGAKVCAAVRALGIPHADSDAAPQVTVSIGAACAMPSLLATNQDGWASDSPAAGDAAGLQSIKGLLARADRAVYAAKAAGRNRVCVDDSQTATEPLAPLPESGPVRPGLSDRPVP